MLALLVVSANLCSRLPANLCVRLPVSRLLACSPPPPRPSRQPGLMFRPVRVPMFSSRDPSTSADVLRRARANRAARYAHPRWGARLRAFMEASGDAATCLRRGTCRPLGGQSVWAAAGPLLRPK